VGDRDDSEEAYRRALAVLKDALKFGIEPSLAGIAALTRRLDAPQARYPCIQVAGTNGKSSTARFAAAFLHAQGKKVGLYTSPELVEYPERMELDGAVVSRVRFAEAVLVAEGAARDAVAAGEVEAVTEFELLTAAALWLFADEGVDVAVLEVGLGGRWDATSIVAPQVAVVTGIDYDHTAILGKNLEQIAAEKAAVIREGSVPVLGPGTAAAPAVREVFRARCAEVAATPVMADPAATLRYPQAQRFPGYQHQNIAVALAAATAALGQEPRPEAVEQVLGTLSIPGRFELLRDEPPLLIDAAHNPQSARTLAHALVERYGLDPATGLLAIFDTLLLGILSDKDAPGIIEALTPLFAHVMLTRSTSLRALPPEHLVPLVAPLSPHPPTTSPSVPEALATLTAQAAAVVATGSITIAGEVKATLRPPLPLVTVHTPHCHSERSEGPSLRSG
jgi:dihydrofolate synthase/folylpolyglutamate synthase